MQIALYIVAGLFFLMGIGIFLNAMYSKFRHLGLNLGAACYLLGAVGAFKLNQWWPLIVAFMVAWLFRSLGGDPGYK